MKKRNEVVTEENRTFGLPVGEDYLLIWCQISDTTSRMSFYVLFILLLRVRKHEI